MLGTTVTVASRTPAQASARHGAVTAGEAAEGVVRDPLRRSVLR